MGRFVSLFLRLFFLIIVVIAFAENASAKKLLILHTNDLHAFLSSSVEDKKVGGYATIKTMIENERKKAQEQGMEVLVLDAGDFLEGSLYYMAERSRRSFNIMNEMGYDAVAVGNHDWLMGTPELNQLLVDRPPQFHYLGANFKVKKKKRHKHKAIQHYIKDYFIKNIHGYKVAIMGLTTNEMFYAWRFEDGEITDPIKRAKKVARHLRRKERADFIITLNHIGFWKDRELARESKEIDFIVGGHSHTFLKKVHFEKNKNRKDVGIVHAGEHGKVLGRLVVELGDDKKIKVLDYKLLPVLKENVNSNSRIEEYIKKTDDALSKQYGRDWLDEIVGETEVPLLSTADRLTYWTAFIADAMREAVDADVSVHVPNLAGTGLGVGPISREDMINAYPRFFDLGDKDGWNLYTAEVYGAFVKSVVRLSLNYQKSLVFSGATFDLVDRDNNPYVIDLNYIGHDLENPMNEVDDWLSNYLGVNSDYRLTNILVNGEPIVATKKYKIALPEGFVVGGMGISSSVDNILRQVKETKVSMWEAIESKIKATGTLGTQVGPWGEKGNFKALERPHRGQNHTFIPNRL